MLGDATLFMRADQVEAGWAVVNPILEGWQETAPSDFPNYQAGSWGPAAADVLIAQDGRSWQLPTILEDRSLRPPESAACLLPEKQAAPPAEPKPRRAGAGDAGIGRRPGPSRKAAPSAKRVRGKTRPR
jgi:hypothetical protein